MKLTCPHGFLTISDEHCGPEDNLSLADLLAAEEAHARGIPLIKIGDIFDLIIYGYENFRDCPAVEAMKIQGLRQDVYYVLGNHEGRIEWMRKLFRGSKVHIVKSLDIIVNGKRFRIEHGDRFAFDWHHLGFIYRAVAFAFLRVAPRLWLRLMKPWMPGAMKPPNGHESQKYNNLVEKIWRNAWDDGWKHKRITVFGHTHCTIPDDKRECYFYAWDDGDARWDGSGVYVDPQGVPIVKWYA